MVTLNKMIFQRLSVTIMWGCYQLYVLVIGTYPLYRDDYLVQPQPFQNIEQYGHARTFKCCESVCKVFDTVEEPYFHPNVEFLLKYGGIREMSE